MQYGERHYARWRQLNEKTFLIDLLLQSNGMQVRGSLTNRKGVLECHNEDEASPIDNEALTQQIFFGDDSVVAIAKRSSSDSQQQEGSSINSVEGLPPKPSKKRMREPAQGEMEMPKTNFTS